MDVLNIKLFIIISNLHSLTKTYKCHAFKLQTTEKGVKEHGHGADESDSGEYCDFYIGADGPNEGTSEDAKNIWGM